MRDAIDAHPRDPYGCAVASLALVAGMTRAAVQEALDFKNAHWSFTWTEFFARRGFATQEFSQDAADQRWPVEPWADMHLCTVADELGAPARAVLLLGSGQVIDPSAIETRRMNDYAVVFEMIGVFNVRRQPELPA